MVAPAAGMVSFAGTVPTSGESVTIQTADGYSVTLTHLGSIAVAKGAPVAERSAVGTIGPSGTAEVDGPYVHLGIRITSDANGYLDPLGFCLRRLRERRDGERPARVAAEHGRRIFGCPRQQAGVLVVQVDLEWQAPEDRVASPPAAISRVERSETRAEAARAEARHDSDRTTVPPCEMARASRRRALSRRPIAEPGGSQTHRSRSRSRVSGRARGRRVAETRVLEPIAYARLQLGLRRCSRSAAVVAVADGNARERAQR